jgi:hypothetical protein
MVKSREANVHWAETAVYACAILAAWITTAMFMWNVTPGDNSTMGLAFRYFVSGLKAAPVDFALYAIAKWMTDNVKERKLSLAIGLIALLVMGGLSYVAQVEEAARVRGYTLIPEFENFMVYGLSGAPTISMLLLILFRMAKSYEVIVDYEQRPVHAQRPVERTREQSGPRYMPQAPVRTEGRMAPGRPVDIGAALKAGERAGFITEAQRTAYQEYVDDPTARTAEVWGAVNRLLGQARASGLLTGDQLGALRREFQYREVEASPE